MNVIAHFDRISRNHHVPPLRILDARIHAADRNRIAEAILAYAAPKVFSRDVTVTVDIEKATALIHVGGFRNAGTATLTEEDA